MYPWQIKQLKVISKSIDLSRLPHALLFYGLNGLGKYDFAQYVAKIILCTNKLSEGLVHKPCDSCQSCQLVSAANHPDLLNIGLSEKSKVIKVKDLKSWLEPMSLVPMLSNHKVAIINNADKMTMESSNSFLKTLEEPAGDTVFILLSNGEQELLPTIQSRCQTLIFSADNVQKSKQWLASQIAEPNVDFNSLLLMSNGAPLLALQYYNEQLLPIYVDFIDDLLKQKDAINLSLKWSKKDYTLMLIWWQSVMVDLIKKSLLDTDKLNNNLSEISLSAGILDLYDFYDNLSLARKMITSNINVRLTLDNLFIEWQNLH